MITEEEARTNNMVPDPCIILVEGNLDLNMIW